jgi:hypothetical protein
VKVIDSYRFGEIVVDGKKFAGDIIIACDGSISNWWRREGHVLNIEDLEGVLEEGLEVLVIGTGSSAGMSVPGETRARITSLGIELIAERTDSACKRYNSFFGKKEVAAAFHLTC